MSSSWYFPATEFKQHQMAQKFTGEQYSAIRYFLGDVRDRNRLEMAMRDIDIVVHAAALKHIPAAEYNPFECIHTNVLGTENIVNAAIRVNVKQVIALSTDKAANPTNLYGASKLAADKIFFAANSLGAATNTYFSVVRYGNVLGSRGSVVPFFTGLARNGATSLPLTDDRMTRFWITLQQSVDFVLSSLITMRGGEILVPHVGLAWRISVRDGDAFSLHHQDSAIALLRIANHNSRNEDRLTAPTNGMRRARIRAQFNADTMIKCTQTELHLLLLPVETLPGAS